MGLSILLGEVTPTVSTVDFSAVTSALSSSFSVSEIVAIIAAVLGAGCSFVILWWGSRKLVNNIITAFQKGKVKL